MTHDVGYLAAFAGGVVSFLSPCVVPIVPAYLAIMTGLDVEQLRDADRPLARIGVRPCCSSPGSRPLRRPPAGLQEEFLAVDRLRLVRGTGALAGARYARS